MTQTIQKLNKLKIPESFMQMDILKGFTYLDKSGEIINRYQTKNKTPREININLNGLVITDPSDKIEQLKVTPYNVWAKFSQPDSLDMASQIFIKEAEAIMSILSIKG